MGELVMGTDSGRSRWEFLLHHSAITSTTARNNLPGRQIARNNGHNGQKARETKTWRVPLTPDIEMKTMTGSLLVFGLIPHISCLATVKLIYLFNIVLDLLLLCCKKKEDNFITTLKEVMLSRVFKSNLKQ